MGLSPDRLASLPNLVEGEYEKKSCETTDYNCIAWAKGDTSRWWWPVRRYYWPDTAPRIRTLDAFVAVFELQGYEKCDSRDLEQQYEKVAIYTNDRGLPTHAAVQRPNGTWSSKLGNWEDIEHRIDAVEGPLYGKVAIILRRSRGG